MNKKEIYKYIDRNIDAHIANIQDWVRQQSVSWDNLGMGDAWKIVYESYKKLGCQTVEVIPGKYYPGIFAYYDAGSKYTFHNYCMYDTRTVENPQEWDFDPWGGEIKDYAGHRKVLTGRGSMGAKGPYVAFLNSLESIIAVEGKLPFNIIFLAEGDEILGSPSYKMFVKKYNEYLKKADFSFCPTISEGSNEEVSIGMGLKGMIVFDLKIKGSKENNGPSNTVHSSLGSLINCPAFRLSKALASMVDEEGKGCKINGLEEIWKDRKKLTKFENDKISLIFENSMGKDIRDVLPIGTKNYQNENLGKQSIFDFLYGPTFNISGLHSGFLGKESGMIPFIIPSEATAHLDMRLVTDTNSDEIIQKIRQHLDNHGFRDIEMEIFSSFDYTYSTFDEIFAVVENCIKDSKKIPIIWPMQGGGGPWSVVPNEYRVPCYRGGVIGGGSRSSINEYMIIETEKSTSNLDDVEKFMVNLIDNISNVISKQK